MYRDPPTDYVAMSDDDPRQIAVNAAVIELVEMQNIRLAFRNDVFQESRRLLKIALRILHPFQPERGWMQRNIAQAFQPLSLT